MCHSLVVWSSTKLLGFHTMPMDQRWRLVFLFKGCRVVLQGRSASQRARQFAFKAFLAKETCVTGVSVTGIYPGI